MVAVIDVVGKMHQLEMAEYRSENGFVMLDAAIMLLSADLAPGYNASNEGTFCCMKKVFLCHMCSSGTMAIALVA